MQIRHLCNKCQAVLSVDGIESPPNQHPYLWILSVKSCPECAKAAMVEDSTSSPMVKSLLVEKIEELERKLELSRSRDSGSYWKDRYEVVSLKNDGLRTRISSLETALKKSKGNAASLVEEHEEEFHR